MQCITKRHLEIPEYWQQPRRNTLTPCITTQQLAIRLRPEKAPYCINTRFRQVVKHDSVACNSVIDHYNRGP